MSLNNPVPDWTSCVTRPTLSSAKAYAICGLLKRKMKAKGIDKYEKIHFQLMNISSYKMIKDRVEMILKYQLEFTEKQTKEFIHEHF